MASCSQGQPRRWQRPRWLWTLLPRTGGGGGGTEHLTWQQLATRQLQETIEHIWPQSPRRGQGSAFSTAERAGLAHDLGNLVLTLDNSRYSNRAFAQKRGMTGSAVGGQEACDARSLLIQEREIAEHATWTPVEVRARKQRLVAWAKQRWGLPGEHDPEGLAVVMDTDEDEVDDLDRDGLDVNDPDPESSGPIDPFADDEEGGRRVVLWDGSTSDNVVTYLHGSVR